MSATAFAGDADRSAVDQSVIQPFANFNLDDGWYLATAPVSVANWQASSSERWVVPVDAQDWQIRFAVQLIFPKR